MTEINTKLKATHNRTYPDVKIGDNVKAISKNVNEGHKSEWSNASYQEYESVML